MGFFCWFSICLAQLDMAFFLPMFWFVYSHQTHDAVSKMNGLLSRKAHCNRICIHDGLTIEISIYSLFIWNGNKLNKAAGISSSLIVTYLFFIFRAIARIVVYIKRTLHSHQQNLCETPNTGMEWTKPVPVRLHCIALFRSIQAIVFNDIIPSRRNKTEKRYSIRQDRHVNYLSLLVWMFWSVKWIWFDY